MQVECHPAGPITAKIKGYRATAGGFVSMTFGNVAGRGTFTAVDLRTSLQVSCHSAGCLLLVLHAGVCAALNANIVALIPCRMAPALFRHCLRAGSR